MTCLCQLRLTGYDIVNKVWSQEASLERFPQEGGVTGDVAQLVECLLSNVPSPGFKSQPYIKGYCGTYLYL